MNKLNTGVCILLFIVFVMYFDALAVELGPEGGPPREPIQYSCDSYKNDLKIDSVSANNKALSAVSISLDYLADSVAYKFYQESLKNTNIKNVLANTLYVHRDSGRKMQFLKELMVKNGNTEFFLEMCNTKNTNINQIAYSLSITLDTSGYASDIDSLGHLTITP